MLHDLLGLYVLVFVEWGIIPMVLHPLETCITLTTLCGFAIWLEA